MKKGFTLAEVLIAVVIIGVIAGVVFPMVNQSRPDQDKLTYQKALYNIQNAMGDMMANPMANYSERGWADESITGNFCQALAESFSTTGTVCQGQSSYKSPDFVTSDGIMYWGINGGFSQVGTDYNNNPIYGKTIYVDRKLSDSELKTLQKKRDSEHKDPGMRIQLLATGKVKTDPSWTYENNLVKSFTSK